MKSGICRRQSGGNVRREYFDTAVAQDFFDLFAGKQIGEGVSRHVFEHALDRSLVIKIDIAVGFFQNVIEYSAWDIVQHVKDVAAWFAPCVAISPCGTILLQKRADDMPIEELRRIKRVPACFTDLKASNWGRIGKRIVCRDYGLASMLMTNGVTSRTKAALWTD